MYDLLTEARIHLPHQSLGPPCMPLFALVGLNMGPPLALVHCLALYWHGGTYGLDVPHVSTRLFFSQWKTLGPP